MQRFLHLKNGIPSEDAILRLPQALAPKQFEASFRSRAEGIRYDFQVRKP